MKNDPTIDRIREIRHQISEECDHDLQKLVAYCSKLQERYQDRIVRDPVLEKTGLTRSKSKKLA